MPLYLLNAARDGTLILHIAHWPDEVAAQRWAAKVLGEKFYLPSDALDTFDKMSSETDGFLLTMVKDNPANSTSIDF